MEEARQSTYTSTKIRNEGSTVCCVYAQFVVSACVLVEAYCRSRRELTGEVQALVEQSAPCYTRNSELAPLQNTLIALTNIDGWANVISDRQTDGRLHLHCRLRGCKTRQINVLYNFSFRNTTHCNVMFPLATKWLVWARIMSQRTCGSCPRARGAAGVWSQSTPRDVNARGASNPCLGRPGTPIELAAPRTAG